MSESLFPFHPAPVVTCIWPDCGETVTDEIALTRNGLGKGTGSFMAPVCATHFKALSGDG